MRGEQQQIFSNLQAFLDGVLLGQDGLVTIVLGHPAGGEDIQAHFGVQFRIHARQLQHIPGGNPINGEGDLPGIHLAGQQCLDRERRGGQLHAASVRHQGKQGFVERLAPLAGWDHQQVGLPGGAFKHPPDGIQGRLVGNLDGEHHRHAQHDACHGQQRAPQAGAHIPQGQKERGQEGQAGKQGGLR